MPFPFDKQAESKQGKGKKKDDKKESDPIKGLKNALKAKEVPGLARKVAAGEGPLK